MSYKATKPGSVCPVSQPRFLECVCCCTVNWGPLLRCVILCYLCVLSLGCSCLVVSTSASDSLERLVSEMICHVLMGTLNPTHPLTYAKSTADVV